MNRLESLFFFMIGAAVAICILMLFPRQDKCSNHYAAQAIMSLEKRVKALENK